MLNANCWLAGNTAKWHNENIDDDMDGNLEVQGMGIMPGAMCRKNHETTRHHVRNETGACGLAV